MGDKKDKDGKKEKECKKDKKEKDDRKEKEDKKEKKTSSADAVVVEADDTEDVPQSKTFKKSLGGFAKLTAPVSTYEKPAISKDDLPIFKKDAAEDQAGPPKCPEGHMLKPWASSQAGTCDGCGGDVEKGDN